MTTNHDPSITVYTTPACVQCNATFKALDKHGIAYRTVDITLDAQAREYVMAMGYLQAPVVVAGSDQWAGFRPDRIKALANRFCGIGLPRNTSQRVTAATAIAAQHTTKDGHTMKTQQIARVTLPDGSALSHVQITLDGSQYDELGIIHKGRVDPWQSHMTAADAQRWFERTASQQHGRQQRATQAADNRGRRIHVDPPTQAGRP